MEVAQQAVDADVHVVGASSLAAGKLEIWTMNSVTLTCMKVF